MSDSTPPPAWTSVCGRLAPLVGLRLRTVTSRRPRSRRYFNQYRRSLRPSEAPFSPVRGLLGSRPLTTTASHQLALDITGAWNHSSGRAVPLEEADDALHPV